MSCKLFMRNFYKAAKFMEHMDELPSSRDAADRRVDVNPISRWFRSRFKRSSLFSTWSFEKSDCSEARPRVLE